MFGLFGGMLIFSDWRTLNGMCSSLMLCAKKFRLEKAAICCQLRKFTCSCQQVVLLIEWNEEISLLSYIHIITSNRNLCRYMFRVRFYIGAQWQWVCVKWPHFRIALLRSGGLILVQGLDRSVWFSGNAVGRAHPTERKSSLTKWKMGSITFEPQNPIVPGHLWN